MHIKEKKKEKKSLAQLWKIARPTLSLVASVALLLVVLRGVDWAVLRASLGLLQWDVLAVALGLLLLYDFFLCVKCYLLIPELPFWRVYCMYLNMRFFSLLPGGNMIGEATRLYSLREMTDMQTAAAIVIMDKQTHMIPLQTYCMVGLALASIRVPLALVALAVWALAWPLLAPGVLFIPRARAFARRQGSRLRRWKLGRLVSDQLELLCGLCETLAGRPRQLVAHLAAGLLGEGCSILMMALLARSLGLPPTLWDWMWIAAIMLQAMMIPLSTLGMGMREGAMVMLLALFGVDKSQAMSLPLIISALTLIKGVAGGAVAAVDRRRRQHQ
ncbi:MAG: flippase-like domain-containing protein [Clostridia bacterium]|nr:flippase-like domain-containing protein [Clostridia bacterium]